MDVVSSTNDGTLRAPEHSTHAHPALEERILDIVLRHRRLIPEHRHLAGSPTPSCRAPHLALTRRAVSANKPLHFVLPAFPGKSSNPQKTLGPLPDLGERLAISFLQSLCDQIAKIYPPGARITVCSDGRVFSDLVKISEENVDKYKKGMSELIRELGASSIQQMDLDDVYGGEDYSVMREELLINHGTSLLELKKRVREGEPDTRSMFNGIHRFMLEDYSALFPEMSRTRLRAISKIVAYRVMQRSNAWSQLVEARLPNTLRLSIHPQRANARKIGIMLMPCEDAWGTPWHNVVVMRAGRPTLMKRRQAEELGAELVEVDGRPSHFVLSE